MSSRNQGKLLNEETQLHSEEVEDIFGKTPHWVIRVGLSIVLGLLAILLSLTWLIKYPDTIQSRISLTTKIPPANVVVRSEGRLVLTVKNEDIVEKGDTLGYVENTSDFRDVKALKKELLTFKSKFKERIFLPELSIKIAFPLGVLQQSYTNLVNSLKAYKQSKIISSYEKEIESANSRVMLLKQLTEQLNRQLIFRNQEFILSKKKLDIDKKLFDEKVISALDFDQSQISFIKTSSLKENFQNDLIQNKIEISKLENQVLQLEVLKIEKETELLRAIDNSVKTLENEINEWSKIYVLESTISGKVSLSKYWSNNQFILKGESVMFVVPESNELFGKVSVPIQGSGKLKVGQRVVINFDNYPAYEFGYIRGVIKNISSVPKDNFYTIIVDLPEGLKTNYKDVELPFKQEMQGSAEIITNDIRLFNRIFNQFKNSLNKEF